MTRLCWDKEQFRRWPNRIRIAGLPCWRCRYHAILDMSAAINDQKAADFKEAGIECTIRQIDE